MHRHESPWHKLTIEPIRVLGEGKTRDELDFHTEHPVECDQLKYGMTCWFDGWFWEHDDAPTEPGIYRARVWSEGPDWAGEYDGGNEWVPLVPAKLAALADELADLPRLLSEARAARGLSLRAAAAEIGISFSTISRTESGGDLVMSSALAIVRWLRSGGAS